MGKENPEQDGTPAPEEPLDELSLRFLKAVHDRDDVEILQHILGEGANLNAKNPDGQTALHLAIHNGDTSMVQFLLEKGADPEATATNGNKPLYDAAESGHFEIVELLLDFNANVEAFNINEKRTAFYQVSLSSTRIAFLLIMCWEPETLPSNSWTSSSEPGKLNTDWSLGCAERACCSCQKSFAGWGRYRCPFSIWTYALVLCRSSWRCAACGVPVGAWRQ
jgi:hypothetical protein